MNETDQMLMTVRDCRWIDLYTDRGGLTLEQERRLEEMRQRRTNGEPLQYILGEAPFYGRMFAVDPRVLVPRPETELLIDEALRCLASLTAERIPIVWDLGTGSGNIAVTLASECPSAEITGVDISAEALDVARMNIERHGVRDRVALICRDMAAWLRDQPSDSCDLIVSNPPYISTPRLSGLPQDVQQEPRCALDGGVDGLDYYRHIFDETSRVITPGGWVVVEIGDDQGAAVIGMLNRAIPGQWRAWVHKDFSCADRVLVAQLQAD